MIGLLTNQVPFATSKSTLKRK